MAEPGSSGPPQAFGRPQGCAYLIGDPRLARASARLCGLPRQPGSVYCHRHHARCHLPRDSVAEALRLHAIETLACAVGGRFGRDDLGPPPRFLARLERLTRDFL